MKRRKFIKKGFLSLAGLGLFSGLYSWQIEPFWLEFVKKKMPVTNLPAKLVGKTLMQISDIHVGNRFDHQFIIKSFKKAQKLKPDFVAYTGDYITYEDQEQLNQLHEVLEYCPKGSMGTVAILGNHDYGKNWAQPEVAQAVSSQLTKAGIELLRNQEIEIEGLNFIGFDDYWAVNFRPEEVMKNYDANKANVLLCHNPDVCDLDVWNNYQGWILAGHTHGGQVKPPFLDPLVLPVKNKKYSAGQIDLQDGRTLYINRALGHLWQVRFNVRPEITMFELEMA